LLQERGFALDVNPFVGVLGARPVVCADLRAPTSTNHKAKIKDRHGSVPWQNLPAVRQGRTLPHGAEGTRPWRVTEAMSSLSRPLAPVILSTQALCKGRDRRQALSVSLKMRSDPIR